MRDTRQMPWQTVTFALVKTNVYQSPLWARFGKLSLNFQRGFSNEPATYDFRDCTDSRH